MFLFYAFDLDVSSPPRHSPSSIRAQFPWPFNLPSLFPFTKIWPQKQTEEEEANSSEQIKIALNEATGQCGSTHKM
jgi:hypothetical protein